MQYRTLGQCGIDLSIIGFGASSLGAEFRSIDLAESMRCVAVALEGGVNLIDTSPYYGRGQSEVLLGYALEGVPRDSYYLSTKLGRYTPDRFDFPLPGWSKVWKPVCNGCAPITWTLSCATTWSSSNLEQIIQEPCQPWSS